jgi:hypothetical protein
MPNLRFFSSDWLCFVDESDEKREEEEKNE